MPILGSLGFIDAVADWHITSTRFAMVPTLETERLTLQARRQATPQKAHQIRPPVSANRPGPVQQGLAMALARCPGPW